KKPTVIHSNRKTSRLILGKHEKSKGQIQYPLLFFLAEYKVPAWGLTLYVSVHLEDEAGIWRRGEGAANGVVVATCKPSTGSSSATVVSSIPVMTAITSRSVVA